MNSELTELLSGGVQIDLMRHEDIPSVRYVERRCFDSPWPRNAFNAELRRSDSACYLVLRLGEPVKSPGGPLPPARIGGILRRLAGREDWNEQNLVGFIGAWFLVDEVHITTIAVDPDYQSLGLGRLMLLLVTELGRSRGMKRLTLEVRESNQRARSIYRRMGFFEKAVRKRYYSDNREDAIVMWSEDINSPLFDEILDQTRSRLSERFHWRSNV